MSTEREGEKQKALFDPGEWWDDEWQDMPEFAHEDLQPFKTIFMHFANRRDMDAFAALIGQKITMGTRSMWYPQAEIIRYGVSQ